MCRLATLLISILLSLCLQAQDYFIDFPKNSKDNFAKPFITLLNDAPHYFKNIKEKYIKGGDSLYPNKKVALTKIKLPVAGHGKFVEDSVSFVEFFYGDFEKMDDAESAMVNLTNQISESMSRKVLFKNIDNPKLKGNMIKMTKVAFTQNSGFFQFNIFVQLFKLPDSSGKLRLTMRVKEGKPAYYYKIMKNEPVNSFMFVSSFKSTLPSFHKKNTQDCLGNLLPFTCKGVKREHDTLMIVYEKTGFEFLPDAKKEFEAALTNLRVSMNDDYVYYLQKPTGNRLREVTFVRFDDIELQKRRSIHLTLVEKTKNDYYLELGFAY